MLSISQLDNEVLSEIKRQPVGGQGEIIFDDDFFSEQLDVDVFLEPTGDVAPVESPEDADDEWWDNWANNCYGSSYFLLLGMYIPMKDPNRYRQSLGKVILFGRNLKWFYKSLLFESSRIFPVFTPDDLIGAWDFVREKTHKHELLHYNVNVFQELFGGSYTQLIEEALAVAWARMHIEKQRQSNSRIKRINGPFYNHLMKRAFDYRSTGYRDWGLYDDEARFKSALLKYISPNNFDLLQQNRVDIDQYLFGSIGQIEKGYVEKVC